MLWTAPELLIERNKDDSVYVAGTPKGDVYSFAIIAQEILYRNGPFYTGDQQYLSPKGYTEITRARGLSKEQG